jgi:hypothetical protein
MALAGDRQQDGTMSQIISLTSFLCREMARMIARAPIRFLSIFVISLAASVVSYGQVPAAGGGSNSGKDSINPATGRW